MAIRNISHLLRMNFVRGTASEVLGNNKQAAIAAEAIIGCEPRYISSASNPCSCPSTLAFLPIPVSQKAFRILANRQ
jgi:hypothetical protein